MKKVILSLLISILFSSCATLFTDARQSITFAGPEGTKIFDASTNIKLAEIGSDKLVSISIKKSMNDKQLLAKKEGYKTTPILLESSFNNTTLWNILFWPGFLVDFGTGQMNKWDDTYIDIEMEKLSFADGLSA